MLRKVTVTPLTSRTFVYAAFFRCAVPAISQAEESTRVCKRKITELEGEREETEERQDKLRRLQENRQK